LNKTYHSGEKFTGANVSTREGQFFTATATSLLLCPLRIMSNTPSMNHYWAIRAFPERRHHRYDMMLEEKPLDITLPIL